MFNPTGHGFGIVSCIPKSKQKNILKKLSLAKEIIIVVSWYCDCLKCEMSWFLFLTQILSNSIKMLKQIKAFCLMFYPCIPGSSSCSVTQTNIATAFVHEAMKHDRYRSLSMCCSIKIVNIF